MRIVRIVQLVVLVLAAAYVAFVQNANPEPLALPWLLSLPIGLVLAIVAVTAFLAGRVPASVRAWRRAREVAALRRRVAELETHLPAYARERTAPVIPDRTPAADPVVGDASGADDADASERTGA